VAAVNGPEYRCESRMSLRADSIASQQKLVDWWDSARPSATHDQPLVTGATLYGGQMALTYTAAVPATMALGYLLLILYFKARGGYSAQVLTGHAAEDEKFTGGTEGPGEG